ncbi:phosphoesterase RecJ domain-containing protein [Niabella drilacis]|uniref:Phosphoesterase RecJ domain-containing protein n=2 Tax=Niabella drilacis (strain DSM 25811 / CCM 8410 / CCUG 62505 / LMG 26954 / E90) TaxID=1285928 RepID=A0A1G6YFB9_NIADE|nr:phosphoesterase RecJ domain-containing protein [Niabella drilacis]
MHQKPDADAMGSALGLACYLRQLGHSVTVVSPTNWAPWLNWMPGADAVLNYDKEREKARAALSEAALLFCLDFNIFHRTKNFEQDLYQAQCIKVLIDHHREPDLPSFNFGISDTRKSSTCEMVYDFILAAGDASMLNREISACLYAGLIADTGSFRFDATTPAVHRMAAHLMEQGIRHTEIHSLLFDNFLENRLRFMGHVFLHRLEFFYEYNTALIAIPKYDILKYEIKTGDTEGLVNFPLSVQGIKLAALVIDREEERKWSFRSKDHFDCNTFARTYFNGGGHFNASGGGSKDSLQDTVDKFKAALKENEHLLQ